MRMLTACKEQVRGVFDDLRQFCEGWKSTTCPRPANFLTEQVERASFSSLNLRCNASTILSIYPLIRRFVVERFADNGNVRNEFGSFIALCDAVDIMKEARFPRDRAHANSLAQHLETAIASYLELFKHAYTSSAVRFKHHQLIHVPDQLRQDSFILMCFAMERKHISAKRAFATIQKTGSLGKCVAARMLWDQVPQRL